MKLLIAITLFALIAVTGIGAHLWTKPPFLPSYASIKSQWQPSYSVLLDRHGEALGEVRTNFSVRRMQWVSFEELSPAIRANFVSSEDKRFWRHNGVDWLALANALRSNPSAKHKRGASTISMQLASSITADPNHFKRRTIREKIRQIRSARLLEKNWSKNQILETWLNRIDFRGEIQGIDAASQLFAGKPALGITNVEAISLAAMVPAPNGSLEAISKRACRAASKRDLAISCTVIEQFLSKATKNLRQPFDQNFAFHAKQKLAESLNPKTSGQRIISTLDANLQHQAQRILKQQLDRLSHRNVRDGAILVVDNESGDILAWVGTNADSSRARFVDGVTARRQAGSSLKPHLFALAIEQGVLDASSILDDSPVQLQSTQGIYAPQNYDRQYVGPVSARFALGNSLNIPAVKTLKLVGIDTFIERLKSLGYSNLEQSAEYYGFALALGSVEVSLFEQVQAYRVLARAGKFTPIHLTANPSQIKQNNQKLSAQAAFIVADMLADSNARQHTFGRNSILELPFPASVKTGTSKAMRDNWCIGFTSKYTVGVWVGNFEGDGMTNVSGTSGAAPIWNEIMRIVHANQPPEPMPRPLGVAVRDISFLPAIEAPRSELFLDGHQRDKIRIITAQDLPPSIIQPVDGTIIAIDPDIPFEHQMIRLLTRGQLDDMRLELNNKAIKPGQLWSPRPGTHQLRILDDQQKILDQVSFSVR